MKNYKSLVTFFLLSALIFGNGSAQETNSKDLTATVQVMEQGTPIHPYTYGMFTELLFNMFENGIWAEKLSDRKFFYPVDNSEELIPKNTRSHQNRWRPVGPEGSVIMDKEHAYVGKHSPKIMLAESTTGNGIKQAGLWLRKGHSYTGRIILCTESDSKVEVSLVWGQGSNERQTITIDLITANYKKFPLYFTAGGDTDDGYIEIMGEGKGSFHIGAVSLMPAENIHGFRKDMIVLLRQLNSGIYRWPGGNFVANYEWRHGIGDPDLRPPRYDYAWNAVESNDVGTDEFLTMCQLLDVEPYLIVNAGLGDAYSAAEWVEYVNGDPDTPMGKWRTQNGHPEPYHVKYWGVGNEMYGEWQLGHPSSEQFALKHNLFAEAMLAKDPSIKLVASGASIYEASTTARHHRQPLRAELPYDYLSPDDWSGTLLKNSLDNIDFLAEHAYPVFNGYFDKDSQKWIDDQDTLINRVRRTPERIKGLVECMKEYESIIPGVKEKQLTCWLDEWVGGNWRSGFEATLGTATGLHEMFRNSDYITMGAFTGFSRCVVYNDVAASMSSKGLLFKMYREHLGTIPVKVTGNSKHPRIKGTVGVDISAEGSGSSTYPLDVFAAINENKSKLTLSIVNPTYAPQEIKISFKGGKIGKKAKVWSLIPKSKNDENKPGEPPMLEIQSEEVEVNTTFKVEALGIKIYELEISL